VQANERRFYEEAEIKAKNKQEAIKKYEDMIGGGEIEPLDFIYDTLVNDFRVKASEI